MRASFAATAPVVGGRNRFGWRNSFHIRNGNADRELDVCRLARVDDVHVAVAAKKARHVARGAHCCREPDPLRFARCQLGEALER